MSCGLEFSVCVLGSFIGLVCFLGFVFVGLGCACMLFSVEFHVAKRDVWVCWFVECSDFSCASALSGVCLGSGFLCFFGVVTAKCHRMSPLRALSISSISTGLLNFMSKGSFTWSPLQ